VSSYERYGTSLEQLAIPIKMSSTKHIVTDRQTDRRHCGANSRSDCVQSDQLKQVRAQPSVVKKVYFYFYF